MTARRGGEREAAAGGRGAGAKAEKNWPSGRIQRFPGGGKVGTLSPYPARRWIGSGLWMREAS